MWNGSIYSIVVIVGPLLLIGAIAWAMMRNRNITPRDDRRTEDATRRMYDAQAAEDQLPR